MADSAKARAEARRKAILARGSDRLSRITTSGRGEDGAAYMKDVSPSMPSRTGLTNFVGETSDMPTPPASVPGSRNVSGALPAHTSPLQDAAFGSAPDPSVWSEEQQQQFMNAMLNAAASGRFPGIGPVSEQQRPRASSTASSTTAVASSVAGSSAPPPTEDPMAALMAAFQQGGAGTPPAFPFPGTGKAPSEVAPPKPKTLLQKLLPIIHIISAWALLAYFAIWREPEAYNTKTHGSQESHWRRWAELSWKSPEDGWGVQTVPFFWAFTTLALVLHTWRIFTRLDPVQPPMLLAFALPHLPPPLPAVITNGLKYLQIGGVMLDDLAGLIVGIGFLIWVANWFAT